MRDAYRILAWISHRKHLGKFKTRFTDDDDDDDDDDDNNNNNNNNNNNTQPSFSSRS